MPLHFRCPCGTVLAADDGSAEKGGQCPSCGKVVIVPERAAAITSEELGPAAPAPEAPAAGGTERIDRPVQTQGGGAPGGGPEVAAPPQETPAEPAPAGASEPAAPPAEMAPAVPEPGPAPAAFEAPAAGEAAGAPAAGACPECGSPLEPGVVLCVQCGLNLQTGEKVSAAAAPGPVAAEADFAEPPEVPAELPADGLEPVSGEIGPAEEPDELQAAAIRTLAELDDIGEVPPPRKRGRGRPVEKKKGGLAGKLIIVFLILLLLAAGAFVAVVFLAPHLLPDQVRALLKAYGIIKAGKVP